MSQRTDLSYSVDDREKKRLYRLLTTEDVHMRNLLKLAYENTACYHEDREKGKDSGERRTSGFFGK